VFTCNESQIPGSGRTSPNPAIRPMPTHPDHVATAAGNASSNSGHDLTATTRPRPAVSPSP
jgi:hypothetical protein